MGMIFSGRRLSAAELQAVRTDPTVAGALLFDDRYADSDSNRDPERVDLDKAWHGIHYLLTGTVWEIGDGLGAAILGGEPLEERGGYPPRLLDPETVRTVAQALAAVDVDMLRARYDPAAMTAAAIYPDIWDEGDEAFDTYLAPHFLALRRFYQAAAADGQAALIVIT